MSEFDDRTSTTKNKEFEREKNVIKVGDDRETTINATNNGGINDGSTQKAKTKDDKKKRQNSGIFF